ncbi:MAG: hypothetical protein ACKVOK_01470, partial [Flavobacteriales bacterium]
MQRFWTTLTFYICFLAATAQNNPFRIAPEKGSDFPSIVAQAESYFADKVIPQEGLYADNEYIRFKRWEWYWSTRVNPDGSFPNMVEQRRAYDQLQESLLANRDQSWTNINQTTALSGYHGMGRLTSV